MQTKLPYSILLLSIFLNFSVFSQNKGEKTKARFGKITPDDFTPRVYNLDSSANTILLADVGSTEIVGNNKGWFSLEHKHYRRAHILNKNGYDVSDVSISLYSDGDDEEKLENLKAVTYNLENGKVVETKLESKAVFKEVISKNRIVKKFTFPNVKVGSIIEYEYRIQSDFLFNLQPWEFQSEYPALWSEYKVTIPQFISYVFMMQGYLIPYIKDQQDGNETFALTISSGGNTGASERYSINAGVSTHRWVMKNVPVLKEESFTSTLNNHIAKIEFQLSEYKEPLTYRNVMGTWPQLTKDLMNAEYFGQSLRKENGWLGDYIDPIIKASTTSEEKARRIYRYIQDNYTCTSHYGRYIDQSLKTIAKSKKGSVSELNLLLVAMLRYANLNAEPVLLSTRSHGYSYALYPLIDRFNYVICQANIGNRTYYLDASWSKLGFSKLLPECYNGHARVINEEATPLDFLADSLLEKRVTSIFIISDEKGQMEGSMQKVPGYYESYNIRNTVKDKGQAQLFSDITKGFNAEVVIKDTHIDSLEKYDEPVSIKYKFDLKNDGEDIIYLNPMFGEGWKENPFKAAERFYPVEMPYTIDETYLLRMDVPKGYVVDELPKQLMVKLNEEEDGIFEFRLSESNGVISIRSRLQLKRAYFLAEEYDMLREFFNMVVKKHNEQIVFKKNK